MALSLQQVGPVDAGGGDPHEHLAGSRVGDLDLGQHERLGAAGLAGG